MNLGRYQLGEEMVIPLHVTDGANTPGTPDVLPWAMVYSAAGAKVISALMAPRDRYRATGLFFYRLQLGSLFALGQYSVAVAYKVSGVGRLKTMKFEVVGGGDANGAVVSMYWMDRPQAKYLVQRTDAGARVFGRNPGL